MFEYLTYKFISDTEKCPFEGKLAELGIKHNLIKPRTPWHNGKVERSHRMDQRSFYELEKVFLILQSSLPSGQLDDISNKILNEFNNSHQQK